MKTEVSRLEAAYKKADWREFGDMAEKLATLAEAPEEAIPVLIRAAKPGCIRKLLNGSETQRSIRVAAIRALGDVGKRSNDAVSALRRYLKDSDPRIRCYAARGVIGTNVSANEIVPVLAEIVQDRNHSIGGDAFSRGLAVAALGKMGGDAKNAIPILIECLQEPSVLSIATSCAHALAKIGPAAVPELANILRTTTVSWTYCIAVGVLRDIGHDARLALQDALKDAREDYQRDILSKALNDTTKGA